MTSQSNSVHVAPEFDNEKSVQKMQLTSFQGRMAAGGQPVDHSIHACSVISLMIIGAHQVGMDSFGLVDAIIDRFCPLIVAPIRLHHFAGLGYTFIGSELAQEALTQKKLLSVRNLLIETPFLSLLSVVSSHLKKILSFFRSTTSFSMSTFAACLISNR